VIFLFLPRGYPSMPSHAVIFPILPTTKKKKRKGGEEQRWRKSIEE
jgi:hypothetical protein